MRAGISALTKKTAPHLALWKVQQSNRQRYWDGMNHERGLSKREKLTREETG